MEKVVDEEQREWATQAVERFVGRFDESYRLLAYHAALPLVLTPELVNYLRNEFLRGENVPWVAEVDLLLSDLVSQVGYELYAMDTHVRAYLLEQMEQDPRLGQQRMQKVARVLYSYVNYLSRLNPGRRQQEIEAQRWAAMVYLGDERCKEAVREITERLLEVSSQTTSKNLTQSGIRAELARLTRITEELSPQLKNEPSLLEYARRLQTILRNPQDVNPEYLTRSYSVEGRELRFPEQLLPENLARTVQYYRETRPNSESFPPLQTFEFTIATVSAEDEPNTPSGINLKPFKFQIARIEKVNPPTPSNPDNLIEILDGELFLKTGQHLDEIQKLILKGTFANQTYEEIATSTPHSRNSLLRNGSKLWKILSEVMGETVNKNNTRQVLERWNSQRLRIHFDDRQNQYFTEDCNGVELEMVQIPGGRFLMGSPKNEPEHSEDESPQHKVTVSEFFMGKYPVTQAQWKAIATNVPKIQRDLNPDPSKFKGENRPVERVSWYDAVEFCARLSQHTGRVYRLPSEAEWEYACRAGTTTPFHFGETITTDLANYNGNYTYGEGPEGQYRKETTPVGSFKVANAFGLYDMHGNVYEWCADPWHTNYEGAPSNGRVWDEKNSDGFYQMFDNDFLVNVIEDDRFRVRRGGSWFNDPWLCRSAYRIIVNPGYGSNIIGFRVVCLPPRI